MGHEICAIPIARVRRIISGLSVYPLPGATGPLRGLAEYNGEPLVVLDLADVVGSPGGSALSVGDFIIVWMCREDGEELVVLAVDEALDIVDLSPEDVVEETRGVVVGRVAVGDSVAQVMDLDRWAVELDG